MTTAPSALRAIEAASAACASGGIDLLQPLPSIYMPLTTPATLRGSATRSAGPLRGREAESLQADGGGNAVGIPAADGVIGVQHGGQLVGRTVHARRRPVGDRLLPHPSPQRVRGAAPPPPPPGQGRAG